MWPRDRSRNKFDACDQLLTEGTEWHEIFAGVYFREFSGDPRTLNLTQNYLPRIKIRENCRLKMRENLFPTVKSEIQICENFFPPNAQNRQSAKLNSREIFVPQGNARDVMGKCKDTIGCDLSSIYLRRRQFLNLRNLPHDSITLKNSQKKSFHSSINKPN